jgi:hypothetical protein
MIYEGLVNGLDVMAALGKPSRCLAFITRSPLDYVQITTYSRDALSVLALACASKASVEVSFNDTYPEKVLTRVRVLDR